MMDQEFLGKGGVGPTEDRGRGPSTANEGQGSIEIPAEGPRPNQVKEWYKNFAPYKNLAGSEAVADRAKNYARQVRVNHDSALTHVREKWKVLSYLFQGNTLTDWEAADAVHVAELYKHREALVPRIEEILLGSDPWFTVKGRERMDERQAWRIKSFLDWELDQCRFNEKIPYSIRAALTYGFCAFKTRWETKVDHRVDVDVDEDPDEKTGSTRYDIKRTEEKKVVWDGPVAKMVDPEWFGIDPKADDPQEATYVFDKCLMTYDDIAALGEQGVFENWRELGDKEPRTTNLAFGEDGVRERMGTFEGGDMLRRPEGAPREFEVTEFWCRFDLYGTGRTRECVITVADQDTVLRVQENPYDDKHRPYCVARLNKDPFNFYAVGPFDHAIPLQVELDTFRQIGQEANKLSMSPIVLADSQGSNLPDSIFGIEPGTILDCSPQDVHILNVTVNPAYMERMDAIIRRDIEETVGAPRIFEGTGDSGTATEIERKIQEGNKRVRGYVRAFTTMMEQLLRQFHSLNKQFVMKEKTFRVLGKAAAGLEEYEIVTPKSFGPELDFEFVGISNLHTAGLEATNLLQFFNAAAGVIQGSPGVVNVPAFLEVLFEKLVGKQPGQQIINVPQDMKDMMDQFDENVLLSQGKQVAVHEMDDDLEHIKGLLARFFDGGEIDSELSPAVQESVQKHLFAHEQQLRQKQVRQQAPQNQAPATPDAGMAFPGQGSMPQSQAASPGQTPMGETPGPTNMARQRKPGRQQGFSQSDNMMEQQ